MLCNEAMFFKVTIGVKVSGNYGPSLALDAECNTKGKNCKRRQRETIDGVVIKSLSQG